MSIMVCYIEIQCLGILKFTSVGHGRSAVRLISIFQLVSYAMDERYHSKRTGNIAISPHTRIIRETDHQAKEPGCVNPGDMADLD